MANLKQGEVLPVPPFFYAGDARYPTWQLTGTADEAEPPEQIFEIHPDDRPPYGVVTTQTCDLVRTNQPWVQVAPVYPLATLRQDLQDQAQAGRVLYLVPLTGPDLPDGPWVADLRIELPIEKGWFVGKHVLEGFASEVEYVRFGDRLAGRRKRPALADQLIDLVVIPLKQWLDSADPAVHQPIQEVRLAVGGSRLSPDSARLLVLTEREPLPRAAREAWDEWWDQARERAAAEGLTLLGSRYATLRTIPAVEYVESAPLDFEYLSRSD